ncbi:MAG: hypothetical protein PVI78_07395, partial [Anaerolineales bacterium]
QKSMPEAPHNSPIAVSQQFRKKETRMARTLKRISHIKQLCQPTLDLNSQHEITHNAYLGMNVLARHHNG